MNRRTGATYPDATVSFGYDAIGRLTSVSDSVGGTITWTYDTVSGGHHPRVQETTTPGTVTVEYDEIGRRLKLSATGQTDVTYTYDKNSRLKTVTQGSQTVTLAYDDAGRRTSLTYPNGVVTSYGYDNASRLLSIDHIKTPTTIEALGYQNDAAGNRSKLTRANAAASLIPQAVSNTAFDAANEQTRFNSASTNLVYDNNGNLTSFTDALGTTTYTWNARNRLTAISGPSLSASFVYDGLGRRTSKTINSTTTGFWYDGADVFAELSGSTPTAIYIRSLNIDEPFIRKQSSGDEFYQTDALGSALALTDSTGSSGTTYTYEPFGKTTKTGTSSNAFEYTGREEDGTGLLYYRARYYRPQIQRFLGEDPLELDSGDTNLYGYVRNNPMNLIDPTGLTWETNTMFLWEWSTGLHSNDVRSYHSYDVETIEMSESLGAEKMREAFKFNGCKTKTGIPYGTIEAAWDTLLNPFTADWSSTAFQVGGFAGASVVDNKNGTVTFRIRNIAGTHSFFYHLVPDRKRKTGPMRNIEQNFSWTERNPCSLSGRK